MIRFAIHRPSPDPPELCIKKKKEWDGERWGGLTAAHTSRLKLVLTELLELTEHFVLMFQRDPRSCVRYFDTEDADGAVGGGGLRWKWK